MGLTTATYITVLGTSFSASAADQHGPESGPYTCHFFAPDPAGIWMKERYAAVRAEILSSSKLTCNISRWSRMFSADRVSIAISSGNFSATLLEVVNSTFTRIVVAAMPPYSQGTNTSLVERLLPFYNGPGSPNYTKPCCTCNRTAVLQTDAVRGVVKGGFTKKGSKYT